MDRVDAFMKTDIIKHATSVALKLMTLHTACHSHKTLGCMYLTQSRSCSPALRRGWPGQRSGRTTAGASSLCLAFFITYALMASFHIRRGFTASLTWISKTLLVYVLFWSTRIQVSCFAKPSAFSSNFSDRDSFQPLPLLLGGAVGGWGGD